MNVFQYSASSEKWFEDYLYSVGYQRKYTFFSDLSIADFLGMKALKDTIKQVEKEWLNNIEAITEFCMALNLKSWQMADMQRDEIGQYYAKEYYRIKDLIYDHYANDKDALEYFFNTTD